MVVRDVFAFRSMAWEAIVPFAWRRIREDEIHLVYLDWIFPIFPRIATSVALMTQPMLWLLFCYTTPRPFQSKEALNFDCSLVNVAKLFRRVRVSTSCPNETCRHPGRSQGAGAN